MRFLKLLLALLALATMSFAAAKSHKPAKHNTSKSKAKVASSKHAVSKSKAASKRSRKSGAAKPRQTAVLISPRYQPPWPRPGTWTAPAPLPPALANASIALAPKLLLELSGLDASFEADPPQLNCSPCLAPSGPPRTTTAGPAPQAPAPGPGAGAPRAGVPPGGPYPGGGRRRYWWRYRDEEGFVSVGVILGAQFRTWFQDNPAGNPIFRDGSGRFQIGPTVTLTPWYHGAIEFDAIRRDFGATVTGTVLGAGYQTVNKGAAWDFPVMVKYRFRFRGPGARDVRPFFGAGMAVRYLSQTATLYSASTPSTPQVSSDRSISFGLPATVGVEFRTGPIRLTPEVRYTYWTTDQSIAPIRQTGAYVVNANQVGFLMGISIF